LAGPLDPSRQSIIVPAVLLAHLDPYRSGHCVALKCQDLTAQWGSTVTHRNRIFHRAKSFGSMIDEFDITKRVLASEI
jgi:hypothetical protein